MQVTLPVPNQPQEAVTILENDSKCDLQALYPQDWTMSDGRSGLDSSRQPSQTLGAPGWEAKD